MAWMRNPYRDFWRREEPIDPRAIEAEVDPVDPADLPDDVLDDRDDDEGGE